jgi:hypothetical protein
VQTEMMHCCGGRGDLLITTYRFKLFLSLIFLLTTGSKWLTSLIFCITFDHSFYSFLFKKVSYILL